MFYYIYICWYRCRQPCSNNKWGGHGRCCCDCPGDSDSGINSSLCRKEAQKILIRWGSSHLHHLLAMGVADHISHTLIFNPDQDVYQKYPTKCTVSRNSFHQPPFVLENMAIPITGEHAPCVPDGQYIF